MHIENRSFLRTVSYLSSIYYRHKEKGARENHVLLGSVGCSSLLEILDRRRKVQQDHMWNWPKPKIQASQS